MKAHEPKNTGIKQCRKRRGKTKDDKNKNQFNKRRKVNKTLRKKSEKGRKKKKKTLTEDNKKEETEDQGSGT
jgi:hypothetical protein